MIIASKYDEKTDQLTVTFQLVDGQMSSTGASLLHSTGKHPVPFVHASAKKYGQMSVAANVLTVIPKGMRK